MARDPRHDILFESVPIGPHTLRNRFYQSPHCTSFGAELPGAQAHIRGMKAEGGWAAVNTEFCSVHPSSDSRPLVSARLWDDDDARNLAAMAELAHEHGALAGIEFWHGGCVAGNLESRLPARSVSQMSDDSLYSTSCYELDKAGIREIQGYYVAAARRARDVGFDIVNLEGAECGAITQHFLMSKYNRRSDEYGGSLENRARFWLETIEQVREAVGDDCAVTARLCVDTLNDSPLGIRAAEEAYQFIELGDHLVDFWDLQAGGWVAAEWAGDDAVASRFAGEFSHREYIEAVRGATAKPIAAVGRFTNPDTMAAAIRSGTIDIIAAARPSIADPFLPQKIEQGRYEEIRECIGCNICASRFAQGAPIVCTQNATLGEEFRRGWHPERFTRAANAEKTVLVLGAGPAGMECAMVLGKRGVSAVRLVDEQDALGGSVRAISAYPKLGEWGRVITYRRVQLDKLANVDVIRDTCLDVEGVLSYGAEIVVIATGARWRADGMNGPTQAPIPGAELDFVHTPEQVSAARGAIDGEHVLVYDTDGYFTAVGMAEMLLAAGKRVTIVTPFPNLAPFMFFTGEAYRVNRELRVRGVNIVPSHVLSEIAPSGLRGQNVWAPATWDPVAWQADAVVLVTQREPCDAIYRELLADPDRLAREGIESLYRIGDCVAPRTIAENIFDGHRLAREIDSADPATPLPFLRELPDVRRERPPAPALPEPGPAADPARSGAGTGRPTAGAARDGGASMLEGEPKEVAARIAAIVRAQIGAAGGGRELADADFLLSIGRGVGAAERIPRLERLAERMGATLCVSGPLVEAGWAPAARKVGLSGSIVAPKVYLALGISGAAPHLDGVRGAGTIIAVNTDANARIFDIAHYGAVADLFEVATELARQLG